MASSDADRAAALLLEVRRNAARLSELPESLRPTGIEQAYAIQDAVNRQLGAIGGWKVSPMHGTAAPGCAPIPVNAVHASPARLPPAMHETAEVEGEIAATLAHDLPPRPAPYTSQDLRAAIAALHPAIEVLGSRFQDRTVVSPMSGVADAQGNTAIVFGTGIANWQELDLAVTVMHMTVDGVKVATASSGADLENLLASLAWLANHAAGRTGGLRKGDVIITGARISPQRVGEAATAVLLDVTGLGRAELQFQSSDSQS
jgi:2-keto-4-pentenoate hydratase